MGAPYEVAAEKLAITYPTLGNADAWAAFWVAKGGYPGTALAAWFRTEGAVATDVPGLIEDYFSNVYVP
jgi:hypothetical protein